MISCSATAISSSSNFCSGLSPPFPAFTALTGVTAFAAVTGFSGGATTFAVGAGLTAAPDGLLPVVVDFAAGGGCFITRAMSSLSFPCP